MLPQIQIIPSNLNLEQTNTKRLCFFNDTISINIRIKKETTDRVTCLSFKLKAEAAGLLLGSSLGSLIITLSMKLD